MLPISAELAKDQIFLDGKHTEMVSQHVIWTKKTHIWPYIFKPLSNQQGLCLIGTLVLDISDKLRHDFFWMHKLNSTSNSVTI